MTWHPNLAPTLLQELSVHMTQISATSLHTILWSKSGRVQLNQWWITHGGGALLSLACGKASSLIEVVHSYTILGLLVSSLCHIFDLTDLQ